MKVQQQLRSNAPNALERGNMFIPMFLATLIEANPYWNTTVAKVEQAEKTSVLTDNYANIAWYESDLFGF